MDQSRAKIVKAVCKEFNNDSTRLMDICIKLQKELACMCPEVQQEIADRVGLSKVYVDWVVSFYAFLSDEPKGKIVIRLCNDVVDKMYGLEFVENAFVEELEIEVGETTPDGMFTLEHTPCIGMCDQAPAVMINEVIITNLTVDKVKKIVAELKEVKDPTKLKFELGDGQNANPLINSMVKNKIREKGPVIFAERKQDAGLKNAVSISSEACLEEVKLSGLRGHGGAGFPAGMKWEFTRRAKGDKKVLICNADEGEPGTFKDRVLLTEKADLLLEGMAIASYVIGADTGIIYLRGEYEYLKRYLENVISTREKNNLLGKDILGKEGFNFNVRVQLGAGAYICGEETALINSCEGKRGNPRNKPPFPAQSGYLGMPTAVNNVETFCVTARIIEEGASWFSRIGTSKSRGTKLLSVSGDVRRPGVYEVPFGITVQEVLERVGALDAMAVQVGGPSGQMIASRDFERQIAYEDLPTGGSIIVFRPGRDILGIVSDFMEFFIDESCGYCTPCRVGNVLLKERLDRIRDGNGVTEDFDYLRDLSKTVSVTSRCGLGMTSPRPILSTLDNFPSCYEMMIQQESGGDAPGFSLKKAVKVAEKIAGRKSVH